MCVHAFTTRAHALRIRYVQSFWMVDNCQQNDVALTWYCDNFLTKRAVLSKRKWRRATRINPHKATSWCHFPDREDVVLIRVWYLVLIYYNVVVPARVIQWWDVSYVVCKTLNNDPSCMEWLYQVITSHVLHSVTHWDNKASLHPIIQTRQEWNISDIAKFSPAQSNFNLVC